MPKSIKTILLLACILLVQLLLPILPMRADSADPAAASQTACSTFRTNEGYFFGDYEQHEYVNGFLVMHFQLKPPYNDGRAWNNVFTFYNSTCGSETDYFNFDPLINPRPQMQYFSVIFSSPTHYMYWDDEANAPIACGDGPCQGDLPATMKDGQAYTTIAYTPRTGDGQWLISDSFPIVGGPQAKVPVIIVPGLLGTELQDSANSNKLIWPDLAAMLANPNGFLNALAMNPDGSSQNPGVHVGNVLSSINYTFGTLHYSDQLVQDLQNQGYVPNQNLFLWPYDWRLGVVQNAAALSKEVAGVLQTTGAAKVDIIAHSYGGLVAKEYLIATDSGVNDAQIDKVIFVGTPQVGSAEAARALIFGSDLGFPLVGTEQVRTTAQNMNSIYDLLPSTEYFKHTTGYYADLSTTASKSGVFDSDQSVALLQQLGKNKKMIDETAALHSSSFDNFDFSTKPYQVYGLTSCGVYTIKTINKMYGDPSLLKRIFSGPQYRIYADSGDGTVLQASASHLSVPTNNMFFVRGVEHAKMLSADQTRGLIENLLQGQSATTGTVSHDASNCSLQGRLLTMNSSVQFTIHDANKNVVDPNTLINKKIGDDSNIFVPNDQNYTVDIKPVDASKPVDFSLTDIAPAKTTISNYNKVNVGSGSVKLDLSATVMVQKQDSSGQSSDLPASSSSDQGDLTGDPGTPIDSGTGDNNSGSSNSGSSSGSSSGSTQNSQTQTTPQIIYVQSQAPSPSNQSSDSVNQDSANQEKDPTPSPVPSSVPDDGSVQAQTVEQSPVQIPDIKITLQQPQAVPENTVTSDTQNETGSAAVSTAPQPIIIVDYPDPLWSLICSVLHKIANLIFF